MWCLSMDAPWYAEFEIWVSSNLACDETNQEIKKQSDS